MREQQKFPVCVVWCRTRSCPQVTAYGGPQPQSNIEYSIVDGSVADISSSGLVDALELGRTVVVGKAVGYDSDTGARVVYSQVRAPRVRAARASMSFAQK